MRDDKYKLRSNYNFEIPKFRTSEKGHCISVVRKKIFLSCMSVSQLNMLKNKNLLDLFCCFQNFLIFCKTAYLLLLILLNDLIVRADKKVFLALGSSILALL